MNDHPRNAGSANFEARQAAAHAAGFWLTDELNPDVGAKAGSAGPVRGTQRPQTDCQALDSTQRKTQTVCDTTPAFGVTDLGYNPSGWDSRVDYADGTSMLTVEDGRDGYGNTIVGTIEPDGSVTGYFFDPNQNLLSVAQQICWEYPTGGSSCWWPPPGWCPYIGGGAGLLAKYITIGVRKGKGGAAADGAGIAVGTAVNQFCLHPYGLRSNPAWFDRNRRVALNYSPSFS